MKNSLFTVAFCLIIFSASTSGQELDRDAMKVNFLEGESWLLFEEYRDALPYYLNLLGENPNNDNYNYRVGMCYLNIPEEKEKAISYLEKAVKNINQSYREGSIKEEQAPPDAYFYLGHAYRVNNQLDEAIGAFREFKKILDPRVYNELVVDYQIDACKNAKKLSKEPLYVDYENLGDPINSRFNDYNAVVSGDESSIVFTRAMQFMDVIMYSKKVNGKWTEPLNMTEMLGYDIDDKCYSTSLSNDGTVAYVYKNDEYDGNIYVTHLRDGIWSPLEKLNANINTKYWESHASVSRDGNTLYFTSNRKDGEGEYNLDIYKSERDSTGDWGPAVSLGPKINTPFNEETPFISDDGKTLYFSSYGHLNMGGYDVFYSTLLESGEWSAPLNMGVPINTTDDDVFFVPAQNGIFCYYPRFTDEGLGLRDIYRYEIYSDVHPRKFHVSGIIPFEQIKGPHSSYQILVINEKGETINVIKPDPTTGEYTFDVIAGKYKVVYENEGYETVTKNISFTKNQPDSNLDMAMPVLTQTDLDAEMEIDNTFFTVTTGDPVTINLTLEPDSKLAIEAFLKDELLNSEEINISDEQYAYLYTPSKGKNTLKFSLTDKFGNQISKEVIVDYQPVVPDLVIAEPEPEVEEGPSEETIALAASILDRFASGDLNKALEGLRDLATGDLKTVLDNLDLDAENITTNRELVDYLINQASERDFTTDDVLELIEQYGDQEWNKTTDLYNNLKKFATGNLKKTLDELDLEKEGIYTTEQLYDYLKDHAEELGYIEEDLTDLLSALAANGNKDLVNFLTLLKGKATGHLARILSDLNLEEQNITTIGDLIAYLYVHAEEFGLTEDDITKILLDLATAEPNEQAVSDYLTQLEEAKEGKGFPCWLLWIIIPAGLILIWLILWNRRKKKE